MKTTRGGRKWEGTEAEKRTIKDNLNFGNTTSALRNCYLWKNTIEYIQSNSISFIKRPITTFNSALSLLFHS